MTVTAAGTDAAPVGQSPDPTAIAQASRCRDCGTDYGAGANFCPHCGQETNIRLPRVFDFLREAADETIGFSGRLPRTLALLLFRPGRLTNEYIGGHRQRYVRPMRLYLSVSLVFFATLGFATSDLGWIHVPTLDGDVSWDAKHEAKQAQKNAAGKPGADDPAKTGSPAAATSDKTAAAVRPVPEVDLTDIGKVAAEPKSGTSSVTGDIAKEMRRDIAKDIARDVTHNVTESSGTADGDDDKLTDIPWLNDRLKRYRSMSKQQLANIAAQGAQANAPYAVFILMPLAAFWYQLFYIFRGRRYAEHLLHAVHLHCFAFCIGTIALLPWVDGWRMWLVLLIGVYTLLAERRVYRSGWLRAGLGTLMGSFLYFIGIFVVGVLLAILALAL